MAFLELEIWDMNFLKYKLTPYLYFKDVTNVRLFLVHIIIIIIIIIYKWHGKVVVIII